MGAEWVHADAEQELWSQSVRLTHLVDGERSNEAPVGGSKNQRHFSRCSGDFAQALIAIALRCRWEAGRSSPIFDDFEKRPALQRMRRSKLRSDHPYETKGNCCCWKNIFEDVPRGGFGGAGRLIPALVRVGDQQPPLDKRFEHLEIGAIGSTSGNPDEGFACRHGQREVAVCCKVKEDDATAADAPGQMRMKAKRHRTERTCARERAHVL